MKHARTVITESPSATAVLGQKLAKQLCPGDVVLLMGELGSGKTVFAQGIGKGLGVKETLISPTFVWIREYRGSLPLYHLDLYRLDSQDDLETLGYEDYMKSSGICLIEWAEKIRSRWPDKRIEVYFDYCPAGKRKIKIINHAEKISRKR